jgi:hypothetical protein
MSHFILVHKVTLPKTTDLNEWHEISVCFERGGKLASTRDRNVEVTNDGDLEITYNETLSLVSTMYKSSKEINKFLV